MSYRMFSKNVKDAVFSRGGGSAGPVMDEHGNFIGMMIGGHPVKLSGDTDDAVGRHVGSNHNNSINNGTPTSTSMVSQPHT